MYDAFFEFRRSPFAAAPDPELCAGVETMQGAFDRVLHCLLAGQGVCVISAPAGMGKTLLCRRILMELGSTFTTVFLPNSNFTTRRSFLQALLYELGQPYLNRDEQELRLELNSALRSIRTTREAMLLIADDAHLLDEEILDEIRGLANLFENGKPLTRVFLSGQLELDERLAQPAMEGLNQRIRCHAVLESLSAVESAEYIEFRLRAAGSTVSRVFTDEALELICRAADGLPRAINQLCDHALLLAYVVEQKPVTRNLVEDALRDLRQLPIHWNVPSVSSLNELAGDDERVDEFSDPEFASFHPPVGSGSKTSGVSVPGEVGCENVEDPRSERGQQQILPEWRSDVPESPGTEPDVSQTSVRESGAETKALSASTGGRSQQGVSATKQAADHAPADAEPNMTTVRQHVVEQNPENPGTAAPGLEFHESLNVNATEFWDGKQIFIPRVSHENEQSLSPVEPENFVTSDENPWIRIDLRETPPVVDLGDASELDLETSVSHRLMELRGSNRGVFRHVPSATEFTEEEQVEDLAARLDDQMMRELAQRRELALAAEALAVEKAAAKKRAADEKLAAAEMLAEKCLENSDRAPKQPADTELSASAFEHPIGNDLESISIRRAASDTPGRPVSSQSSSQFLGLRPDEIIEAVMPLLDQELHGNESESPIMNVAAATSRTADQRSSQDIDQPMTPHKMDAKRDASSGKPASSAGVPTPPAIRQEESASKTGEVEKGGRHTQESVRRFESAREGIAVPQVPPPSPARKWLPDDVTEEKFGKAVLEACLETQSILQGHSQYGTGIVDEGSARSDAKSRVPHLIFDVVLPPSEIDALEEEPSAPTAGNLPADKPNIATSSAVSASRQTPTSRGEMSATSTGTATEGTGTEKAEARESRYAQLFSMLRRRTRPGR